MDLPRPAIVKQLDLSASPEGKGSIYLLLDRVSGRIFRLSREAAAVFNRFSLAACGNSDARGTMSEEDAKFGYSLISMVRQMRDAERFTPKPFNPLSLQFPLFELQRFQPRCARLSRIVFGPVGALLLGFMIIVAMFLGARNGGAVVAEFDDALSVEALLTFGALAPFLKVFHEFGHFLAGTRYNIRLRKAGINFIGFYPLPYVDCSDADLRATRNQRLMISAAGVFADLTLGLLAFVAWHFVEDAWLKTILGRAFVFLTISSVFLNANPLMRLDGYYILSDLLHRRNLSTDATSAMKAWWRSQPYSDGPRKQFLLACFGVASLFYRFFVLFSIVWAVLPRFLGLGVLLGFWGGWLMLAAPMLRGTGVPSAKQVSDMTPTNRKYIKLVILVTGLIGLMFVPVAPRVIVDLNFDYRNHYSVSVIRPGYVSAPLVSDELLTEGQQILRLENENIDRAVDLGKMAVSEAELYLQIARGIGEAEINSALERLAGAQEILALAEQEQRELIITAAFDGRFISADQHRTGKFLGAGTLLGQIFPYDDATYLSGKIREYDVDLFDQGLTAAEVYDGAEYIDVDINNISLVEVVSTERSTNLREFMLKVNADVRPHDFNASASQIKLTFQPFSIWQHIVRWLIKKRSEFRDAELAELKNRIE